MGNREKSDLLPSRRHQEFVLDSRSLRNNTFQDGGRNLGEDLLQENLGLANLLEVVVDNCRFGFLSLVSGTGNIFNVR